MHSVHVQLQPYYVHVCLLTKGQEIMFFGFDVGDKLVTCHQNCKQHILQSRAK